MTYYNTRVELLSLLPENCIFAELGVFKGDFSKEIIKNVSLKELFLVDIWEGNYGSGDKDGNNHINIKDMETVYLNILHQTLNKPNIHVVRSKSVSFLKTCEQDYFDCIYVDGDHTAKAVYEDLTNSYRVLKEGGMLMGHDYHYTLGGDVVHAVNSFCENFNQQVNYIANDGCPSFVIQIKK
jgi:hypothetical protein